MKVQKAATTTTQTA